MPNSTIIKQAFNACAHQDHDMQLAAVLFKGGSVLRIATNSKKYIRYRKKFFSHGEPSRHAELSAIHAIPRDVLNGCSLLVVRLDRKGNIKSAKPCSACAKSLYDAGVKKVWHTTYSGEIVKFNFQELLDGNYEKESFRNYVNENGKFKKYKI